MKNQNIAYHFRFVLMLFITSLGFVGTAVATPIFTFTGGAESTSFADRTFGYNFFTGNSGLTVSSVGFWDAGGDGLVESHEVGIWTADGSILLTSAVVGAGTSATLDSGFRFVEISKLFLDANTEYLIGAFLGSNVDAVIRHTSATSTSGVTMGSTRYDTFSGIFSAPTGSQGTGYDDGYFGPNLNGLVTTVPEPSSIVLLGIALVGLGLNRRRKIAQQ